MGITLVLIVNGHLWHTHANLLFKNREFHIYPNQKCIRLQLLNIYFCSPFFLVEGNGSTITFHFSSSKKVLKWWMTKTNWINWFCGCVQGRLHLQTWGTILSFWCRWSSFFFLPILCSSHLCYLPTYKTYDWRKQLQQNS